MSVFKIYRNDVLIGEVDGCPVDQPEMALMAWVSPEQPEYPQFHAEYVGPDPWDEGAVY